MCTSVYVSACIYVYVIIRTHKHIHEEVYFKELEHVIVKARKSEIQAGILETQTGFVCCSLEAELLFLTDT